MEVNTMGKKDRVIIVIPAKGISKRLPGKNLLKLGGVFGEKTLTDIAAARAMESGLGKVVVSTDSDEVFDDLAGWVRSELANTVSQQKVDYSRPPYLHVMRRPKDLCKEDTRAWEVCLSVVADTNIADTLIMTLPTSPFCTSTHIRQAYDLFLLNDRKPVMSVCKVNFNPDTIGVIKHCNKDGFYPYRLNKCWSQGLFERSYIPPYISNGAVWVVDVNELIEKKEQYIDGTIAFEMDEIESINIDTNLDYITACAVAKVRLSIESSINKS